ncbi:uncharacterized protein BDR25DRAFT_248637, partial [Lindgomyces ingoldianus]
SLWLFTYSDLKTMVFPSTAFALLYSFAESLSRSDDDPNTVIDYLARRIPSILLWAWMNCLAFNVNNQRLPHAIQEDELNKSWRPLPSHRLTLYQASLLARVVHPITAIVSCIVGGGLAPSSLLAVFSYADNDLRYGDTTVMGRNVLNACGFTSFAAGALQVAIRSHSPFDAEDTKWLTVITLVVFSAVHIQDLYDQVGDKAAGRLTIALVLGDHTARYTIIAPLVFWSGFCPTYWKASSIGYYVVGSLAIVVVGRLITLRTVEGDRRTFLIYNGWLVATYMLPLLACMRGGVLRAL